MLHVCYLNISGLALKRLEGCSLTSLCLPTAASDSTGKKRERKELGNNYCVE